LPSLLVIPVGLVIVKRFAESVEDKTTLVPLIPPSPVTPVTPIVPVIPTFTPQEQQAFTRERILAPSGTPEQAKMLIESGAIKQGKIVKFGTGVSLADLLARQTPRK
jgi:hypothetical protein